MRSLILIAAAAGLAGCALPPPAARLNLSNFAYDQARVQTVVTAGRDCGLGPGYVGTTVFTLPLNGTRVIEPPPGADVCWRHAADDGRRQWSLWSRAYLAPGRTVDAKL